ncbi:uncharacterized protein PADG_12403 [Paracoccidioides brasiliensis Pb18]|uniref:Uncharacterized protein n=1 Tax=Paracoccidioides brasiliensis (strain Pb18) TaxID=502780 RepID=A0A0A0HVS8_PARBD|nr:uncharacterized protein PADG_12403 [Paracoccidioides brasiliensis Pb18]KGM91545.1 hypothetical protein PADG_12403 [Paracoccidioides brasiliensis Pb18]
MIFRSLDGRQPGDPVKKLLDFIEVVTGTGVGEGKTGFPRLKTRAKVEESLVKSLLRCLFERLSRVNLVSIINHATINGINSDEAAEMSNHPWS